MTVHKIVGYIVVLGSPNDSEGNLSEMGRGRVKLGYETYSKLATDGFRLLLTGGFGDHFNTTDKPNAWYAREMMLSLGVPPDHIVEFAESRNTLDDALEARPIVVKYGAEKLVVVSSDFHLGRVRFVFEHVFPDRTLDFVGAPYLDGRTPEEQKRLLDHEAKELTSLREKGVSITGGQLSLDAWKEREPGAKAVRYTVGRPCESSLTKQMGRYGIL